MAERAVLLFQELSAFEIGDAIERRVVENGLARELRALEINVAVEMGVGEIRVELEFRGRERNRKLEHRVRQDERAWKDEALEAGAFLEQAVREIGARGLEPKPGFLIARLAEPIERKNTRLLEIGLRLDDLRRPLVPSFAAHIMKRACFKLVHAAPNPSLIPELVLIETQGGDNGDIGAVGKVGPVVAIFSGA